MSNHLKHSRNRKTIKTAAGTTEEHNNGSCTETACSRHYKLENADEQRNWFKRGVKLMYAVLRNGASQGVQTAPMRKILLST